VQRLQMAAQAAGVVINLLGNRVLDEVLNAVTHGLGEMLVLYGCYVMHHALKGKPDYVRSSVVVYLISLNVLYTCSTLYHSFFALGRSTVHIFELLDFSGIFILIAGSYTPFLGILFHGQTWARMLLGGMWMTALSGILTAMFYHGPYQIAIRLSFYIGMGWTALTCVNRIMQKVGTRGTVLLVSGGVLYTAGVPFFVKNGHTWGFPDHSIWHLFVICASVCHFICILNHVVHRDQPSDHEALLQEQGLE